MDKDNETNKLDFALENQLLNNAMIEIDSTSTGKINLGGKDYTKVSKRLQILRQNLGFNVRIKTELLHIDEKLVVAKAAISIFRNNEWHEIATGHAEEKRDSSEINKFSAVENAETSSIGRALATLGLSGDEYASIEEIIFAKQRKENTEETESTENKENVDKTQKPQKPSPPLFSWMKKLIKDTDSIPEKIAEHFKVDSINTMDTEQVKKAIELLKRKKNKNHGLAMDAEEKRKQEEAISVLSENKKAESKPSTFTKINTDTGEESQVKKEDSKKEDDIVIEEDSKKEDDIVIEEDSKKEDDIVIEEGSKKEDDIVIEEGSKKEDDIVIEEGSKKEDDIVIEEGSKKEDSKKEDDIVIEEGSKKENDIIIKEDSKEKEEKQKTKAKKDPKEKKTPAKKSTTRKKASSKKKDEVIDKPRESRPNDLDDDDEITI